MTAAVTSPDKGPIKARLTPNESWVKAR